MSAKFRRGEQDLFLARSLVYYGPISGWAHENNKKTYVTCAMNSTPERQTQYLDT